MRTYLQIHSRITRSAAAVVAVVAILIVSAGIQAQVSGSRDSFIPFEQRLPSLVKKLAPSMITIQVASSASGAATSRLGLSSNKAIVVRNIPALVIDSGGYLICAASLLVDNDSMFLKRGQIQYAVERVGIDYRSGMALLRTSAPNLAPVKLADAAPRAGALTLFLRATGSGAIVPLITIASGASQVDGYLEFNGSAATTSVGGAFFDMSGELVAMALGSLENGPSSSRIFAVPSTRIGPILSRLRCCGDRTAGYLGVQVIDTEIRGLDPEMLQPRSQGAVGATRSESIRFASVAEINQRPAAEQVIQATLVTHIEPGSPAERSGLAIADVIFRYNNLPAVSAASLRDFVRGCHPDSVIHLSYLRGSNSYVANVTIGAAPLIGGVDASFMTPVLSVKPGGANSEVDALRSLMKKLERRIGALEDQLDENKR